jgi:hypothetical protein
MRNILSICSTIIEGQSQNYGMEKEMQKTTHNNQPIVPSYVFENRVFQDIVKCNHNSIFMQLTFQKTFPIPCIARWGIGVGNILKI